MVEVLGSRDRLDRLLEVDAQRAVRANRLKTTPETLRRRLEALGFELDTLAWTDEAFRVREPEDAPALGATFEHRAGHAFVQAPVSSLPVEALDPKPGERVLDLAAAPGSKATHLAERMEGRGLLVANDPEEGRVNHLIANLDRCGAANAVVTQNDGCRLRWPDTFDRVLVDAPCSTLGSMHADWAPIRNFEEGRLRHLVGTQRSLLSSAFHAVREGGVIVYATCTLEPRENEAVASWFLDEYPVEVEPVRVDIGHPGFVERAGETHRDEMEDTLRIYADEVASESFYVARFRKTGEAHFEDPREPLPRDPIPEPGPEGGVEEVAEAYGLVHPLVDDLEPMRTPSRRYGFTGDPDEAMELVPQRAGVDLAQPTDRGPRLSFEAAVLLGRDADRTIELDPDEARRWLAGHEIELGAGHDVPERFAVVTCRGEPIGCSRPFGTRLHCYVPKQRRIPDDDVPAIGFLAEGA
jgi:16S rRNA (cytosine1407-C5)-methyltransferase